MAAELRCNNAAFSSTLRNFSGSSLAFQVRDIKNLQRPTSLKIVCATKKSKVKVEESKEPLDPLDAWIKNPDRKVLDRTDDPFAWRTYREPMEGDEPDFWDDPKWDSVGFVLNYFWAFGIVVSLLASGTAVFFYNKGASTDFKDTETFRAAQEGGLQPAEGINSLDDNLLGDAPPL